MFFTTNRGVYNFARPPPQPQTHRASAYRALSHGPQPLEPQPMGPQPLEPQPIGPQPRELQPR